MFREVSPEEIRAPPKVARVVVLTQTEKESRALELWKNPPSFLVRVSKVDKVLIMRREGPKTSTIMIKRPIIPTSLAIVFLMSIPSCIMIDAFIFSKKRRMRTSRNKV